MTDGHRILTTAAQDKTVRLWDIDGNSLAALEDHASPVSHAIFSPDGRLILTVGDNSPRLWASDTGKTIATLRGHTDKIQSALFSPDGRRILTASTDRTARLWDGDGKPITTVTGHSQAVLSVMSSLDGRQVLTASGDGTTRLWRSRRLEARLAEVTTSICPNEVAAFSGLGSLQTGVLTGS